MTTAAQRAARESFDLEAAMQALPVASSFPPHGVSEGRQRLCPSWRALIPEGDLRELARETLGALRVSAQYLEALRVVLGNQARAEHRGYVVEMNVRTSFTTERTMRTILGQLKGAGATFSQVAQLGRGRSQLVQCFGRARPECREEDAAEELARIDREREAEVPQRSS